MAKSKMAKIELKFSFYFALKVCDFFSTYSCEILEVLCHCDIYIYIYISRKFCYKFSRGVFSPLVKRSLFYQFFANMTQTGYHIYSTDL